MNQNLKLLIDLQRFDDTIAALETEIRSLPQRVAELEGTLAEHIQRAEADRQRLADNQRARRKREGDVSLLREKISRYKDQTLEVKTNEQYRALQHEIEFHEAEIRRLEDEILVGMIDSESLEKRLREAEQDLATERAVVQIEVAAAEQKQREDEERLREVLGQRAEIQRSLASDVYDQYERIAKFRKGQAVVVVQDGSCGACYVRLRPQAYNEVMRNEQILSCESCGRILYYALAPVAD